MISNKNIYYCFIKPSYLRLVYDFKKLELGKYVKRPFIYIPEFSIALAIPEKTNYSKYRSKFNFYFNENKNYLDIESLIYVNYQDVNISNSWNIDDEKIKKLDEIYSRKKELFNLIEELFKEMNNSLAFEKNHMHIIRSKLMFKK